MKLNDFVSKNGRTLLGTGAFRLPESEQNTKQDASGPLTPEQIAEKLAKRGIRLRNPDSGQQKPLMPVPTGAGRS